MKKYIVIFLGGLSVFCLIGFFALGQGWFAKHRYAGEVSTAKKSPQIKRAKILAQNQASTKLQAPKSKQILFGDFHVHTTFSLDAFFISLPMLQGLGAHPPADACDFARFCSNLDFWSINDHAEGITPTNWQDTKRSIRQCDAVSGPKNNQDLVSFLGWEWTQVGNRPDNHYGHKNVIIRGISEDDTPTRPIASIPPQGSAVGGVRNLTNQPLFPRVALALVAPGGQRSDYLEFNRFITEVGNTPPCPKGVHVKDLSENCYEGTQTPKELFRKLDEWGFDSIVIPHGTSWGFYTPSGSDWRKQLGDSDVKHQGLIEVMSGHGNSEEYRNYKGVIFRNGKAICPEPHNNYLPSCWQAGTIIYKRCLAQNIDAQTCDQRAQRARQIYAENGVAGYLTVSGGRPKDWLDSGQCKDCFLPSFNHRPLSSVQYILAITNFDDNKKKRFRMGFIASSDNHNAQAGTGYKEFARHDMTEVSGTDLVGSELDPERLRGSAFAQPVPFPQAREGVAGFQALENERNGSFFLTGGLVAVHSQARSRDAIWQALEKRETYGTSGERILLWFNLRNAPNNKIVPMGGEMAMNQAPSFIVRAAGAFKQKKGCPKYVYQALGAERVKNLCLGECYNPTGQRKKITHIDVIRIMPQEQKDEDIARLIKDPWKRIPCNDNGEGCVARFSDPEFAQLKRDMVYYVRAYQKPSPTVNGDNLRCSYDSQGNCIKVNPCFSDYRTERQDNCLALKPELAWSSPIYVDYKN